MTTVNLVDAINEICLRPSTGITADQIDVTALAGMTAVIRGLVISQVTSIRAVLDIIRNTYFVDCVLSDKMYFFPMGGASVATIPYSDLGADGGQPFILVDSSELEIYAQFSLSYSNVNNDHQTDVQMSDRLLSGQSSIQLNSVPFDFTEQEAKIIVDTQLMLQAISMRRCAVAVGRKYFYVQAGDSIIIVGLDGSSYYFRVAKVSASGGVYALELLTDDATAYIQAGITSAPAVGQTTVNAVANTILQTLDTPLLNEVYDTAGFYVAVKASSVGWLSGTVFDSTDNVNFDVRAVFTDQAVMGSASTTLGNWTGGNVIDITNTLIIDIGATNSLSSTTVAAILLNLSTNLIMVGSELVQFLTATLVAPGVYTLSGFLRGRRGTEWAIGSHISSEEVVVLSTVGVQFIPISQSDLGRVRYLKPVTSGQREATVSSQTFTPMGIALKPFAPLNLRANRASTNTILSWERRTRYGWRITGPLAWSSPLGEGSENYVIEIYSSGAYTTLKRTLTSTTPSVTYTSAQQVTDFGGNQSIIYAKIYQVSSTVGRGYALTASS